MKVRLNAHINWGECNRRAHAKNSTGSYSNYQTKLLRFNIGHNLLSWVGGRAYYNGWHSDFAHPIF